jgi:5-methylcytosine-specific restriction endonuclease McrA
VGRAEYDHALPDFFTKDASAENCRVLCSKCHRLKTSTEDVPRIAETKRQQRKNVGAWPKTKRPLRSRGFPKTEA